MARKALTVVVAICMLCCSTIGIAESTLDLSGLTYDELVKLHGQINLAMWECEEWQEVVVPNGVWQVGTDIPEGHWTISVKPEHFASVEYGDRLDETGTQLSFDSKIYISNYLDNFEGSTCITQFDIQAKAGCYFVISNEVVFTPYAGKQSLGFGASIEKSVATTVTPQPTEIQSQNDKNDKSDEVPSVTFASTEKILKINGINIPLVGADGEMLSIGEVNGTIYVPIESFLNALGVGYTISKEAVNVTYTSASGSADVDEYSTLLPEEKVFVDLLLKKASSFKNPSTITLKSMIYVGSEEIDSKVYVVNISAQNGFGGYTSEYYMIMYDGSIDLWLDTTAEKVAELVATMNGLEQPAFDYGRINRAIRQKVSELGY